LRFADLPEIPDEMGGQLLMKVVSLRFDLDHHPGQVEQIALQNGQLFSGEVLLDEHWPESVPLGFLAQFLFKPLGIQTDEGMNASDEFVAIGHFFRNDIGIKGGTVVHKEFPVPVEKHATERRHILEPNPVVLRLDSVRRTLKDLEKPQPQQEHDKHGDHEEGQIDQSLSQNLY
jgi:hypothetical protein